MKYAVTLGQRIIRKVDGRILDTKEVYKHYRAHRAAKLGGRADLGSARWGKGKGGQDFTALAEWRGTALIWVCLPDPRSDEPCFFTHVCKIEKFHHSSFGGGSAVIGAGEWVVSGGKLLYISANSGHYRPDLTIFHNSVLQMTAAFSGDTQVTMYDSVADSWVHRPVMQFIRSPSGNGRYKTHPEA